MLLLFNAASTAAPDDVESLSKQLQFHVTKGHLDKIRELLDAGADPNFQFVFKNGRRGPTALSVYLLKEDIKIESLLLSGGADPNIAGDNLPSPLARTVSRYETCLTWPSNEICQDGGVEYFRQRIEMLLDFGADPDFLGNASWWNTTPLIQVAQLGDLALVQRMVTAGADIDRQGEKGISPLAAAASAGHFAVVQWLVTMGAEINQKNNGGGTALNSASKIEIFNFLLDQGADVTLRSNRGTTIVDSALSQYKKSGDWDRSLLDRKKIPDLNTHSFAYAAVRWRDHALLERVIALGADVNMPEKGVEGKTPLILAITNDDPVAVGILLSHGASPYQREMFRGKEGRSPREIAELQKNTEIIALLRKYIDGGERQ